MLIPRRAGPTLQALAREYPVVVVTGPRQSGKTTLCRASFPDLPYASLEEPDVRGFAVDDPRGFLAQYPNGALLDEVQRAPELLSYLQGIVDRQPRSATFVLTGSQQLDVLAGVTQTLAGRVALLSLLPFALGELPEPLAPPSIEALLYRGFYPPIHDRGLDPSRWLGNYVQTYLERDLRQLVNIRDLSSFQVFLRLCAGRTGQLVNLSALAADCGITHNTARAWLSVLESSFIVIQLRPHFRNFGKRLVKTPKLYFVDSGLAAWLLEIRSEDQLNAHPLRGALFETWAISELLKGRANAGLASNLYFWRDRAGLEVDCVLDRGTALVPVEIKSGQTVASDFFASFSCFSAIAGDAAAPGWIVYGGTRIEKRSQATALPWRSIDTLVESNL
jgi:predicted AAA+ superfamily ATPase